LNRILTNDVRKLQDGEGQYTQICNPDGGTIDDLYLYRLGKGIYTLVVNASRIDADADWFRRELARCEDGEREGVIFADDSSAWGALALQGPKAGECLKDALGQRPDNRGLLLGLESLEKNQLAVACWPGVEGQVIFSRTGYTGEDGFELLCSPAAVGQIWDAVLEAGASLGVKPCGLGARDTLRTEVCYPLYGHELDEATTPIEAGVGWSVALDKGDFIGRDVLVRQNEEGVDRRLIAFKMTGRSAPPRPGYPVWSVGDDAKRIGEVTSGTQSPSLGVGIGLGYISREFSSKGTSLEIEIRGRRAAAEVAPKPLYRPNTSE